MCARKACQSSGTRLILRQLVLKSGGCNGTYTGLIFKPVFQLKDDRRWPEVNLAYHSKIHDVSIFTAQRIARTLPVHRIIRIPNFVNDVSQLVTLAGNSLARN
jgi:hypothetical protein